MTQPCSVTHQQPIKAEIKQEDVFSNVSSPLSPTDYISYGEEYAAEDDYQIRPPTGCMPSDQDYPGDYSFQLLFISACDKNRWSYSSDLNKLYTEMNHLCPINFRVCYQLSSWLRVRALPVFSEAQFMSEPVKRCLIHSDEGHHTNKDSAWPHHLIRCHHQDAIYEEDPVSKRLSVVVPLETPQPGSDIVCRMFKFMCLGSCVGGINRRPLNVIFTLETEDGTVMGRRVVAVRICSCPNRDHRRDEKNEKAKKAGKQVEKVMRLAEELAENCTKKRKLQQRGQLFFVPVYGHKNYQLVWQYAEQLEMAEKFASKYPAEAKDLQERRAELEKQLHV